MAIDIDASLHSHTDIRLSKIATALILAKRAGPDGIVKISYSYLAVLLKCCRRTAIRHIKYLVEEAGILTKSPRHWVGKRRCDWNIYRFRIKFRRIRAHPYSGDIREKMSVDPKNLEEKRKDPRRDLEEQLRNQERAMRLQFVTPGTEAYARCQEEIARLRALLEPQP